MAITKRERKRLGKLLKRSLRRPAGEGKSADTERQAWIRQKIAEMQAQQKAAWQKQVVVPSKSMQLRLDRAARDMRQRVERGEGALELRLLDVRFWDFRTAFEGVSPDRVLSTYEQMSTGAFPTRHNPHPTLYDWWLTLFPPERHMLLELVRLEVGETSVSFRPKRKCPYCGKVVRVVDRDRDEWPFLAKHRGRGKPSCPGSYHVIDDLTEVRTHPRD